jgi:polyferredoxin
MVYSLIFNWEGHKIMNNNYFIKTNRIFTPLRKYAWIFTLIVAIGGLWYPKLGLLVFGVILGLFITGILKGRYWCGNICPHGSLFDHVLLKISSNAKFPKFFQSTGLKVAAFGFFAFSITRKIISATAYYNQAVFWDKLGFIFVTTYLMVLIVGVLFSFFINSRTWCNFCPMGTLQTLSYKLGKLLKINRKTDQKVSITDTALCHSCGKCSKVCPMQLSPYKEFNKNNQFDNDVCIQCSTCVENCPVKILSIDKVNRS